MWCTHASAGDQVIYTKLHQRDRDVLLAACDEALLGKTFGGGGLEFTVSEMFYKGELVAIEELAGLLENATTANLVGEEVVEAAVKARFVAQENIKTIGGVPHAHVYRMI